MDDTTEKITTNR